MGMGAEANIKIANDDLCSSKDKKAFEEVLIVVCLSKYS